MKRLILNLACSAVTVVMAGDLLYLYGAGLWREPLVWVERLEIACLYLFIVLGIVNFAVNMSKP